MRKLFSCGLVRAVLCECWTENNVRTWSESGKVKGRLAITTTLFTLCYLGDASWC